MNKRILFIVVGALVYALSVVLVGRLGGAFGLVKHVGLWVAFITLFRYRHTFMRFLLTFRYPMFLVYVVSALPLMIFEENINCLPTGCQLVPVTIPFLLLFIIVLYGIVRVFKVRSLSKVLIPACMMGVLWEALFGVAATQFQALPLFQFLYIALWTWMSYAFFTLIPLQYLIEKVRTEASEA